MQRARAAGSSPVQAAASAIRDVGLPCALTSLTTAVGFGSLAVGNVPIIQRFGILSACSVVIAFAAVITLMPLLASSFGELGEARLARAGARRQRLGVLLARPIDFVLRHARAVSLSGVAAVAILAVGSSRLVAENRLTEALPRGNDSYAALKHCEEAFGGVLPAHVLLEWSDPVALDSPELFEALREVEELLEAQPQLSRPVSIRVLLEGLPATLRGMPGALELLPADLTRRFLRPDLSMALVSAGMPDGGSEVMLPLFEQLRSGLRAIGDARPGISLHLTGTDVIARTHVNRMIAGLAVSLGFAGFVIFGVIALAFRSMRLGLISLIPNLFPLVLIGAGLATLRIPLQMGTAVLFTVLLGLAVDDTIHFLARARLERIVAHEGALRRTYLAVGKAIVTTTIVLIAGFGIILLSSIEVTRLFALLACLGFAAALVGDLLLLPALLATFAPRRAPPREPGERREASRSP
jgi:predicted RND superfamily exporter protein